MLLVKCDKCGKIIERNNTKKSVTDIHVIDIHDYSVEGNGKSFHYDICTKCLKEVYVFLGKKGAIR